MTPSEHFMGHRALNAHIHDAAESGSRQVDVCMATCAACGQSYLTTPSDPPARLFCDPCLASLEARQAVRDTARRNAVLNQGGLF